MLTISVEFAPRANRGSDSWTVLMAMLTEGNADGNADRQANREHLLIDKLPCFGCLFRPPASPPPQADLNLTLLPRPMTT